MAAILHGSARVTFDVENIERLAAALAPYRTYLRDAEPNLPFAWDAKTISGGLNFTLTTDLGDVDLFSEVAGSETYSDVLPDSFDVEAFGVQFKCMDLPDIDSHQGSSGQTKRSRSTR